MHRGENMGQIQSILYSETMHDLEKASRLFSQADYDEALPILLRRLPLLDKELFNNPTINQGFSLLARVYLKLQKNDEALKVLQAGTLRSQFPALYVYSLNRNKRFDETILQAIPDSDQTTTTIFCTLQLFMAQLYANQAEELLLEARSFLQNIAVETKYVWALLRSFYYELDDQLFRFPPEGEEMARLIQKEINETLKQQWYSSHNLHSEWKEAFIDVCTDTFRPITESQDTTEAQFKEPIPLELEWALEKLLANMDAIPPYEISKTIGPLL